MPMMLRVVERVFLFVLAAPFYALLGALAGAYFQVSELWWWLGRRTAAAAIRKEQE